MSIPSFLALLSLSSLAFLASVSVAVRARLDGRAELLLAASMLWNFLILVPIHLLGVANRLTATSLGVASALFFLAVLGASFVRIEGRAQFLAVGRALVGIALLPIDAIRLPASRRSVVTLGAIAAVWAIGWTAWMSYLLPSDGWDGIWYHELMPGYAIQAHGYTPMPLPPGLIQQANGYPRNCEMTNLWFVIFTGQTFMEAVNSLAAIPVVAAAYVILRRYSADRVTALGWACFFLWVPGLLLQLRSNYIDVHVLAFYLGALHFATRPVMRVRDGWFAAACLGLLIGGKSLSLVWTPMLALIALARLAYQQGRRRPVAVAVTALGAAVIVLVMASVTYLRNYLNFHNPIWPIAYANPKLHINWPGASALGEMDWNRPAKEIFAEITRPPVSGKDFADTRVWGYGLAVPFLLIPLSAPLLLLSLRTLLRGVVERLLREDGDRSLHQRTWNALVVAIPTFATVHFSPALWQARYNLHIVFSFIVLAHWASGLRRWARFGEGLLGFALLANFVSFYWVEPGWGLSVDKTIEFAKKPFAERRLVSAAGWSIAPEVAKLRESELGAGDVVVFSDDIGFPAVLWNDRYTNKLVYLPPQPTPEQMVRRLDEVGAKWAVATPQSQLGQIVGAHPDRWEPIGLAARWAPCSAFRRTRR